MGPFSHRVQLLAFYIRFSGAATVTLACNVFLSEFFRASQHAESNSYYFAASHNVIATLTSVFLPLPSSAPLKNMYSITQLTPA